MKTVDCYRPGCYCTMDHQVDAKGAPAIMCPRCGHHRLIYGRTVGDL